MQMIPVRVFFSKTGRAKYTSHLDTMRTMTRAFRRSGLPLWYTEGFNPHLYMTFALPIALGYEGLRESVDIRLVEETALEDVVARINASLPPGFEALAAAPPVMDAASIAWAKYALTLYGDGESVASLQAGVEDILALDAIEVEKKTKKGVSTVNIKPHLQLLEMGEEPGALLLRMRFAAGIKLNINPTLFLEALYAHCGMRPDRARIVRQGIFDDNMAEFQ